MKNFIKRFSNLKTKVVVALSPQQDAYITLQYDIQDRQYSSKLFTRIRFNKSEARWEGRIPVVIVRQYPRQYAPTYELTKRKRWMPLSSDMQKDAKRQQKLGLSTFQLSMHIGHHRPASHLAVA